MSVQVRQRLPMNGDVVQRIEGARLRTLRSEFNSLHPFHLYEGSQCSLLRPRQLLALLRRSHWLTQFPCSRGLTHDDTSVLTKRSGLDSRREFHLSEGSATQLLRPRQFARAVTALALAHPGR